MKAFMRVVLAAMLLSGCSPAFAQAAESPARVTASIVERVRPTDTIVGGGGYPSISGSHVAYTSAVYGRQRLYVLNLDTGARTFTGGPGPVYHPDISGSRIAYECWGNVYVYDLTSRTHTRLTSGLSGVSAPRISGRRVTYSNGRRGNSDVYVYDVVSRQEKRITSNASNQFDPSISGARVVYDDDRLGHGEVYLFDLATGKETLLSTEVGVQSDPLIAGSRVVYRSGDDLMLLDLASGRRGRIVAGTGRTAKPTDIGGTSLVYQTEQVGELDPEGVGDVTTRVVLRDLTSGAEVELASMLSRTWYEDETPLVGASTVSGRRAVWQHGYELWAATVTGPSLLNLSPPFAPYGATPPAEWLLRDWDGSEIPVASVATQLSSDGTTWRPAPSPLPPLTSPIVVRFTYRGDAQHFSATSPASRMEPVYGTALYRSKWPQVIDWGERATLHGRLANASLGRNLAGCTVRLEWRKSHLKPWTRVAVSKRTDSGGRFSFSVGMTSRTEYRFVFDGTDTLARSSSRVMVVTPRVYLTVPTAASTIARGKGFTSRGYLKPFHASSAGPVRIQCSYRKRQADGTYRWRYYESLDGNAWLAPYRSYCSYKASIRLPYRGRWRIRAYWGGDGSHAPTSSAYRYVTVK